MHKKSLTPDVVTILLKGKKEDGVFKCMVCPILQQQEYTRT